jgi:adenylate cyclase
MRATQKAKLATFAIVVVVAMMLGAVVGILIGRQAEGAIHWAGVVQGMVTGGFIAAGCAVYDLLLLDHPALQLGRLPFGAHILLKTAHYIAIIVFAMLVFQAIFAPYYGEPALRLPPYFTQVLAISLLVALAFNLALSVSRLLGPSVLRNFLTGRYHLPREEVRIFLFVDLVDSTRIAEAVGPLRFHALLNDVVSELSEPILAARGEIYRYVGDEVIVTWPLAVGLGRARCLTCYFDMLERLAVGAPRFRERYGLVPQFRAALHCGPVVVGEMGVHKQEIVVIGDTVNVTARLEQLCRDLGRPFLCSADILRQLTVPAGLAVRAMGPQRLRGKAEPIEVFAVEPAGAAADVA